MRTLTLLLPLFAMGCFTPLYSPGIPAAQLPDEYRMPTRTHEPRLDFSQLVVPQSAEYRIGRGDKLAIVAPDLIEEGDSQSFTAEVLEDGSILLPRVGPVDVGGSSIREAQDKINTALSTTLNNPQVTLRVVEFGVVRVIVLGEVNTPGTHELRRNENDVAHAIAAAGGFTELADDVIELHRQHQDKTVAHRVAKERFVVRANNDEIQRAENPQLIYAAPAIDQVSNSSDSARGIRTGFSQIPAERAAQPSDLKLRRIDVPIGDFVAERQPASRNTATEPTIEVEQPVIVAAPLAPAIQQPAPKQEESTPVKEESIPVKAETAPKNEESEPEKQAPTDHPIDWTAPGQPFTRLVLRGNDVSIPAPADVVLNDGDVVVIPKMTQRVFYVVGPLSRQFSSGFVLDLTQREIGNGFLLPKEREIDVLTAVAMAGYIDPIASPTTVTLQRRTATGDLLLVRVDLIQARSDVRENLYVQPGDIIYLNPDGEWWFRRMFDRILPGAVSGYVANLPD